MEPVFDDPVKNEVWQVLRSLNYCWTKGDPTKLSDFFHKDMVAITATDRDRLEGRESCIASWADFVRKTKIHRWIELDPQIQLYGNAAVVTYYFDMEYEMEGHTIKMGGRDMFVFVKENERWWAVADQFSPYPQSA
ncbi:MAG: nuclear transport factor 2 family protein [Thermodesulfobacteriota bacterium]